eukprot:scaffold287_cov173-Amphora_coffeaeformis.AAC.7
MDRSTRTKKKVTDSEAEPHTRRHQNISLLMGRIGCEIREDSVRRFIIKLFGYLMRQRKESCVVVLRTFKNPTS